MNIAFSGLLLLILFLPGVIFRIFIIKSDSFENPLDTSKGAELVFIVVPSLFFHAIGYYYFEVLKQKNIALDQLYYLLIGNTKAIEQLDFAKVVEPSFLSFFKYIFILCLIGALLGYLLKKVILLLYLDLKFSVFAISNEWDNILSGRTFLYQKRSEILSESWQSLKNQGLSGLVVKENWLKFKDKTMKYYRTTIDFIDIDVLVNSAGENLIYSGVLSDYFLAKENSIDKLYLINPLKKRLDFEIAMDFVSIPSDTMVIKNENIINLNFRVVWYEEESV